MFLRTPTSRSLGFTLIELAIVLGVVGVLSAGLWRLMSAGNQQSKDQVTAQQQLSLINAVKGFLADTTSTVPAGGQQWLTALGASATANLPLPTANGSVAACQANYTALYGAAGSNYADLCNFLPTGFTTTTTNSYGHTYMVQVLKDASPAGTAPKSYSFTVISVTPNAVSEIPDTDGGRISSLIGSDGGFLYTSTAVCGSGGVGNHTACGSMGAWTADVVVGFGYPAASVTPGTLASRTFVSSTSNSSYEWLARVPMPGDTTYTYNTMTADMFLGTYKPGLLGVPVTNGYTILSATPATMPTIHLQNGRIDGAGTPDDGYSQLSLHENIAGMITPASVVELSNAPPVDDGAGGLGIGCTALTNLGSFTAACPPVLVVWHGDISVPEGIVSTQKVFAASDLRLKRDIYPISDALTDLMKINPVNFTFKSNNSRGMGVIAQELEKVYPQLVLDTGGTKYVEYNGLIGPLIGAVQELKHQNDELRTQLAKQSVQLQRLEHPKSVAP
jgi:prepilin-type N-terminal cleavage/methylation domain-containing protein